MPLLEWMGRIGMGTRTMYTTVNKMQTKVIVTIRTTDIWKKFKIT